MSSQSFALASLTATYTDSEGEEDGVVDDNEKSPNDDSSADPNISNITTPPVPVVPPRLVSYHDDTVISDDEGTPGEGAEQERQKSVGSEGDPSDGVHLPPEPTGLCSNSRQDKISRLYERVQSNGLDMNHVIQQRKDFHNPSIYEKLIQFCSINEFGTNYPAHAYDPLRWGKESFYEELARVQKAEMDRREKERKDKTKVEFVSGTAKRPGSGSGAEDDAKRRKSKWDQVGTMVAANMAGGTQAGHILKPAGLLQQPSLTTGVTAVRGGIVALALLW
ncbi:SAP30-binding protein isoform X3 [Cryptotermes secundus]|uniref:SAP30-binding protein isoform X3 n=1 Tax=Cryptotermes secundus TaxID=105785 RepID=UPI000CD7B144|nr:SAP30-binding protein isoform X3 [Cryptotermes secundus]